MGEVNHFMRVSQFKDRVDSLLAQSLLDLSMTLAVLARIENNNFEIVAVRSNSVAYVPGEKFELGDSYSRDVFEQQKIISSSRKSSPIPKSKNPRAACTIRFIGRCRWRAILGRPSWLTASPGDAWISAAWRYTTRPSASET
jgi:hypothetical protein